MKRYVYGFLIIIGSMLAASAFTACVDDDEPFGCEASETDVFSLVVSVPHEIDSCVAEAADASRAGETTFNEFKVKSLHFYFYPAGSGDDVASLYDYVWTGEFDNEKKVTVPLPNTSLFEGGIFGAGGTTCIVYAVANVDATLLPQGTAKTINQLKATAVSSTFNQTKVQDSFAMDGQSTVTINRDARKATGEITLSRAAAKITLTVNLPATTMEEGGRTYTPNTDAMHVWIGNGVMKSKLNTAPEADTEKELYTNQITLDEENIGTAFTLTGTTAEKKTCAQNVPFYSYPNKWNPTTAEGNCYLTLMVPWKYSENGVETQVPTYYRIALKPENSEIVRNTHHDIYVSIDRLGNPDPNTPIDMEYDWSYVLPWNSYTINTDIKQIRYLLLNNNYYDRNIEKPDGTKGAYLFEMDNETSIEIPVGTSHDVEIASVTLSWLDYSKNPIVKQEITLTPNADGEYKYSNISGYSSPDYFAGMEFDNNTSKLLFKRDLVHINGRTWVPRQNWIQAHWEGTASVSQIAALNSYTFDIVLQHKDDENRKAYVRVIQYPGIYITAQSSEGETRFVNNNYSDDHVEQGATDPISGTPPRYGYVNIDNGKDENGDIVRHKDSRPDPSKCEPETNYNWDYYLGCIEPNYLGSNIDNTNTYIINISRFNTTDGNIEGDYIIADPREREVNNFPMTRDKRVLNPGTNEDPASWSVPDVNGNRLRYYYPTSTDPEKRKYIAPKYRVASKWGMTQSTTFEGAKRRCASYQENGRPAGRWRLPTIAEVEYIARLSNKGYIPYLFGSKGTTPSYFCGNGLIKVDNSDNPEVTIPETVPDEAFLRCVYDEWYWGTDTLTNKTEFVWGDRPRSLNGN